MIDFGFDKIALIGAVALIVIGPEKLPRVARTVGHMLGKAQRYVGDVKAEVNRSIELEELKKMKTEFEDAARDVEQSVNKEVSAASAEFNAIGADWASDNTYGGSRAVSFLRALPEARAAAIVRREIAAGRGELARFFLAGSPVLAAAGG